MCIQFDSGYLEKKFRQMPPCRNLLTRSPSDQPFESSTSFIYAFEASGGSDHSPISM